MKYDFKKKAFFCVLILISLISAVEASTFNVANGDWSSFWNWSPWGVPGSSDIAIIDGSRVCNFNTSASVSQLQLGTGSDGTLNISGGTLTTGSVDKSMWIGNTTNTGYLTMTGGQIISNSRISIGGEFNNNGGYAVVNLSGDASISQVAGIGHAAIGFGSESVVDITMGGTSVMEFTNLASNEYVDLRLGTITVTQSDSSRIYSSGNIRLGGTASVIGQGVSWTITGGTIEAGYGIFLYNDSHINIGGDAALFAASVDIGSGSTINISDNGTLNVWDMSVSQVQAIVDSNKINGSNLQVISVDIAGTIYTQVAVPDVSLNVTTAKNCSPADISGGDCIAGLNDLETIAGQWLDTGAVVSDLSGNNVVDFEDFAMLAAYWLDEGPFETFTNAFTVIKTPDSSSYFSGTSVSLIAVPQDGWRLDYWTGDFSSDSYIADVLMDSDKNITAVYSQTNAAHDEIDYTKLPVVIPGQTPIISESPYIYERDIYGYNPSFYPGEPAFDYNNRAYMRATSTINTYSDGSTDGYIQALQDDGTWQTWDIIDEIQRSYPSFSGQSFSGVGVGYNRIVFDKDGDAYTHVRLNSSPGNVVLYKPRYAEHWQCIPVPVFVYAILEPSDTYKTTAQPPLLVGLYNGGIYMQTLTKTGGSLSVSGSLIPLADSGLQPGLRPDHSGGAAVTATVGDKTWLVYASSQAVLDQSGDPIPGTPQYIVSYDHSTQTLGTPILLGFGQNAYTPEPDNHNGPAIVADSTGLLHVVMGAHQSDLWYTHSTTTNPTSISDWTTPVSTGTLRQSTAGYTYPSLVIDSNDTLHLIARNVSYGDYPNGDPLPGMTRTLDYMRAKRSGNTWTWEDMSYLVIPWHDNYSIYYQKLSIDKHDRLFLFYRYYHNGLTTAEVAAYEAKYGVSAGDDTGNGWYSAVISHEPIIWMSDDGGDSWRIALTGDFLGIVD